MEELLTSSYIQTRNLGKAYAKKLRGGEVLALHGDLGAGKTTFMQGLAKGLGISRTILSPTFIIVRSYDVPLTKIEKKTLYHVDLYRIENEKDVMGLGLLELFGQKNTIIAIEWSEKITSLLPKETKHIYFEYRGDKKRSIRYS